LTTVNAQSAYSDDYQPKLAENIDLFEKVKFLANLTIVRFVLCSIFSLCFAAWFWLWGYWEDWRRLELRVRLTLGAIAFIGFVWFLFHAVILAENGTQ
jgi:hypothetical protein